jgi:hypothetical protein
MDRVGYESLLDALFKRRAVDERPGSDADGRPERQPAATPSPAVDAAGTEPAAGRPAGQPQGHAVQPQGGPVAAATQAAPPADPDQDDRRAPAGRPPDERPAAKAPAAEANGRPGTPAKASAKAVAQAREALDITAAELAFMKRLASFVPTPRSAKRLANTYRLLRVLVTEEEAATFGPDRSGTGHYMVALTLLAILVGFPGQATTLFGELLTASGEDWAAFRKRLRVEAERGDPEAWERLCRQVDLLATTAGLPKDLGPYQYWCRRVARYSFQTGRLAMATGWDDAAAPRDPHTGERT